MTTCKLCNKRETKCNFNKTNICNECSTNENNYEGDIIFVDASNKMIQITSDTEIELNLDDNIDTPNNDLKAMHDFKDSLLASLYSQVEFQRDELRQKNVTSQSTIKLLQDEIQFLREELREKNILIKMAIDSKENCTPRRKSIPIVNISPTVKSYAPKIVDYDDSDDENDMEENSDSVNLEKVVVPDPHIHNTSSKHRYTLNSTPVSTPTSNDSSCYQDTSSLASSFNDGRYMYSEQYKWEKHSSGVASRILNKMGFSGKGLGKTENGITEPITAENLGAFSTSKLVDEKANKRKLLYVLSSSMLNQLDENRLGNKDVEVRVQCHGGCTIRC